jgi:glyoxylase-like metal-dependent hydrolase (beta-lactamase superfamily II)
MEEYGPVRRLVLARTILGRGMYFTSAYRVGGLLIDTGCRHTAPELLTALEDSPPFLAVNTHSHEDHIGANADLMERFDVTVMCHPAGLPVLADPAGRLKLKLYQRVMWGVPRPSDGFPLVGWVETEGGRFRVISTPGHSPDHLALYEPDQGWLFTGDAFVGGRDRVLRADYNIWGVIQSLRKLTQLDVSILFPAGGRVRNNPAADLTKKIEYLEDLGGRAIELQQKGLSARRIRKKLLGPEPAITYITGGHFSGVNLIRSFIQDRPPQAETNTSIQEASA